MAFDSKTKGRAWVATIMPQNLVNVGLSEDAFSNPELVATTFTSLWADSGTNRVSAIVICKSAQEVLHAHMALYGNTTTLTNVSKLLGSAHVEPQLGGKKELKNYLLKEGKYEEKGEKVLYSYGMENIHDQKGQRTDLEDIEELLNNGATPEEIFATSFRYRRFEKMIKSEYLARRIKETPLIKEMKNEYHFGASGSGKTFSYITLCQEIGDENIYLMTDTENGGLDKYLDSGAPDVLFIDEFKGNMKFSTLLILLDKYSRSQTHARYVNAYNLWARVIITSVYPIEEVYSFLVDEDKRMTDSFTQLIRRFEKIVYHYVEDGNYKTFELPASEYIDSQDMKAKAHSKNQDGFLEISEEEQLSLPFNID